MKERVRGNARLYSESIVASLGEQGSAKRSMGTARPPFLPFAVEQIFQRPLRREKYSHSPPSECLSCVDVLCPHFLLISLECEEFTVTCLLLEEMRIIRVLKSLLVASLECYIIMPLFSIEV